MFERAKRFGLKVANKIFLRSTTHQTHLDVQVLARQVDMLAKLVAERLQVLEDRNAAIAGLFSEATNDTRRRLNKLSADVDAKQDEQRIVLLRALEESVKGLEIRVNANREDIVDRLEAIAVDCATSGQVAEITKALNASIIARHEDIEGRIDAIARDLTTLGKIENAITGFGASLTEGQELILRRIRAVMSSVTTADRMSFRQNEALQALGKVIGTNQPLPYTRGWAASPDLLLFLHETIRTRKPELVVEFGSGVTTLVIADALRQNGEGRLCSFDHDTAFAMATRNNLEKSGLSDVAQVNCVQLTDWIPPASTELGDIWRWYDLSKDAQELVGIDILLVDGPPTKTCAFARYPAGPALIDRMKPKGLILLDDTIRQDETRIAEVWRDQLGLELVFQPDFEKGLAVLTLPDENPSHPAPSPKIL